MQPGQPLRIVAEQPWNAQGLDCDGGACGFAFDAPLRFKFDRWLLPSTAVRQSISLRTEGTQLGVFLFPEYDVTARALSYRPETALAPDTVYLLTVIEADEDANGFGFRAYDGKSLSSSQTFAFRTSSMRSPISATDASSKPNCSAVLTALQKAGCAAASCHGSDSPRMGLSLDSVAGLQRTAIDHVAHQSQLGTEVTQQVVSGGRFGTQMPIIDSGRPENSYLMYKLLIGSWLNREMDTLTDPTDPFAASGLTPGQIEDARAWFVEFGPMPPDNVGYPDGVSPLEFVTTVQGWIRAGAVCP